MSCYPGSSALSCKWKEAKNDSQTSGVIDVIKSHRSYKCGIKPGNIFVYFLNLKSSTVDSKADINKKVPVGKLAYPKLS